MTEKQGPQKPNAPVLVLVEQIDESHGVGEDDFNEYADEMDAWHEHEMAKKDANLLALNEECKDQLAEKDAEIENMKRELVSLREQYEAMLRDREFHIDRLTDDEEGE